MASPSGPPPPYPVDEKGGGYPGSHPVQPGYPPAQGSGYPPAQPGYPPYGHYPGQQPPPLGGGGGGPYNPPPQQQPYPDAPQPQVMHPQTTVIVNQTGILFRDQPVQMNCPSCHSNIVTAVTFDSGTFTWLICVILFLVGCDLGCCLIPFCVDGAKDAIHSCPNCNTTLGRYSRL